MRFPNAVQPVLVLSLLLIASSANAAVDSWWDAAPGAPPDSACWTLFDSAPLANPVLAAGKLTLATVSPSEAMYYQQEGTQLSVPASWVLETGMRVVSESHDPGPRWGVAIGFAPGPGIGNVLLLGMNQIMLWSGFGVAGPVAAIPTTDRVHAYRVEIQSGGTIKVYQDGPLVLTGALIFDPTFGASPYVYFGDGSSTGSSTTEWTYFKHNGAASYCPALLDVEDVALGTRITLECPSPNPASQEALLRFALERETRLELCIFDAAGRRVRTLEAAVHSPGKHEARWDLSDDTGRAVQAGLYFARLEGEGRHLVRRLAVMR